MTYEEEPNIFSETDITPEEYAKDAVRNAKLAFADWLEKILKTFVKIDNYWIEDTELGKAIKAKIKELRSDGKRQMTKLSKLKKDDEFVKGMIYAEKKFADWLEKWNEEDVDLLNRENVLEFIEKKKKEIEAKIKELRSDGK